MLVSGRIFRKNQWKKKLGKKLMAPKWLISFTKKQPHSLSFSPPPALSKKKEQTTNQTKPNQTKPNQTRPNQTKPNQTKPDQTKPNQTKPNQANRQTDKQTNKQTDKQTNNQPTNKPTKQPDRSFKNKIPLPPSNHPHVSYTSWSKPLIFVFNFSP